MYSLILEDLLPNTPLVTRQPQKYTNARVVSVERSRPAKITVLTDYGNLMILTLKQLQSRCSKSSIHSSLIREYAYYGMAYPNETIRENIITRIALLKDALEYIKVVEKF